MRYDNLREWAEKKWPVKRVAKKKQPQYRWCDIQKRYVRKENVKSNNVKSSSTGS